MRAFAVGAVRLALAASVAAIAAQAGDLGPGVVGGALAVGAVVFVMLGSASRRSLNPLLATTEPLPAAATIVPLPESVLVAMYPSTIVVTVLALLALATEAVISVILGGVLCGMGLLPLASGAQLVLWERRSGTRLYASRGPGARAYVADRPAALVEAGAAGETRGPA
jgi:hypothetical protein